MKTLQVNRILECEGLSCPLPVVRTKKAMDEINRGEVLEVRATDKGSIADLQSWANRTGHQYVGLLEEGGIYRQFIRKGDPTETREETKHPYTITNEELQSKIGSGEKLNIIDVREPVEYVFGRIPGAMSIPLGELEQRLGELDSSEEYFIVCRTGSRSDLACQTLTDRGFQRVKNVLPGMSGWIGETEKN